ncbi:MAG: HD-GYP domain-containing protein [Dehalococcoidia bacterium]
MTTSSIGTVAHTSGLLARIRARHVGVGLAIVAPSLIFATLVSFPALDPHFGNGTAHFYIVSAVSALAFAMAVAVLWAARTVSDPRTTFLALAFLSMAGIFLAHGLGTSPLFSDAAHEEHAVVDYRATWFAPVNHEGATSIGSAGYTAPTTSAAPSPDRAARLQVVGYSAQLSLSVSALFFFLATLDFGRRGERFTTRWYSVVIGGAALALTVHALIALWYPRLLTPLPLYRDDVRQTVAVLTTAALLLAAWRFAQAYRLAMLPLQGAMAFAMLMLVQAQWFQVLGSTWALSWWEYHIVMLGGFLVGVGALLHQYRVAGDLSAVVEGLFLRNQIRELRHGDPAALRVLTAAVAAKDTETAEHIDRVGDVAVAVGERLWLPGDRLDVLRWSGRLHDVGKIGVPNSILRKPGPLTPAEFEVVKLHAPRGWRLALASGILAETAPIIRAHHERLDGTGYPDGLAGDQIPFEARIVAVADVWDALTSDRPYRAALSNAEAVEIIEEGIGTHFDPECVRALREVLLKGVRRAA